MSLFLAFFFFVFFPPCNFHWCDFRKYRIGSYLLRLFIPYIFLFFFLVFSTSVFFLGAVSFAGTWAVHEGGVVTVSDLKEVLIAKTEEKDRQRGSKERSNHEDSYYSRISCQHKDKTSFKQIKKTAWGLISFIFSFLTSKHSWRNTFFLLFAFFFSAVEWVKERKRETGMFLWPFEAITAAKTEKTYINPHITCKLT